MVHVAINRLKQDILIQVAHTTFIVYSPSSVPLPRSPSTELSYFPILPKEKVPFMLAYGLTGDWGPVLSPPGRPAANYLKTPAAHAKCRRRFQAEVRAGRMIGGPGGARTSFRRPLLIWIYAVINQERPRPPGHLPPHTPTALRVWHRVINRNRGLSIQYIMNRLPAVRSPIFVDASTSSGPPLYEFISREL